MPAQIVVVAGDANLRDRLATLIPADAFVVAICSPFELPLELPQLYIVALPGLETPEEQLIAQLRADAVTADIPIVIVSALPMVYLQSLPYASDWTIAIVEEPVDPQVLSETMGFLLNLQQ